MSERFALVVLLAVGLSTAAGGEEPARIRIEVRAAGYPVERATVVVAATGRVTDQATDADGVAHATTPAGVVRVTVAHEGFVAVTVPVVVAAGTERVVRIDLQPELTIEEEVTVVATTRTGRRIEDQPLRVEALDREEIEEKMLMTPGDIVMMLNEMGGMRVQATSPSLGAASLRIQGMRGRYTRILSDGLPLYGSQPGGLGLLQIPPMDLEQVEVVKGVASALHGAGAMGGVVNLLSRRPGDEPEREILINQSTRGATDGVLWLSTPLSATWGLTLVGGGHRQSLADVDGDGWVDMARYGRGVVRPRIFWNDGRGGSLFLTAGVTRESRGGGTPPGHVPPATRATSRPPEHPTGKPSTPAATTTEPCGRRWPGAPWSPRGPPSRDSSTITVSGRLWSAIGTGRASPRSRCDGRRGATRGLRARRSSTTPTAPPASPGSPMPSPRRACSCRTTSTCGRGWRCR